MSSFIIEGGRKLSGEIEPQGAKNEALQILCAVLLSPEKITINNVLSFILFLPPNYCTSPSKSTTKCS